MTLYQSEFARRLRSQSSNSPGSRSPGSTSKTALPFANFETLSASPRVIKKPSTSSLVFDAEDDELTSADNSHFSRPSTPQKSPRRRKTNSFHADRFIPSKDDGDVQATFQLMSNEPSTPNKHKRKISTADMDVQREEANETFNTLLSTELFGSDSSTFAAALGVRNGSITSVPSRSGSPSSRFTPSATASRHSSGRQSLHGSQPSTPTKRNIFQYSSKSPSLTGTRSSRSQSITNITPPSRSRNPSISPSRKNSVVGLFGGTPPSARKAEPLDSPQHDLYNSSPVSLESQRVLLSPRKPYRSLSKVPYKVLDAPDLADDFYLNLVDWSSKNVLGVGLSNCVYLWSAQTSNVTKLCEVERERDRITSVNWSGRGDYLAVGLSSGLVQIWDPERVQLLRTFSGHTHRVGSLAWNEHILSTGSRDRAIYHRDVRVRSQHIHELKGHVQEICGLKWNTETNQLASGGNDNKLYVWDGLSTVPLYRFNQHKAAVKAIAWSPHQNGLLASGGGTADMHIRFFNTITGQMLSEVDTGSQVCNLAWSQTQNEIISTHGYSGGKISNQVQVWRYPDMTQVATLLGHTMRVLYLAMSPDGDSVVSGAGDETLRFWDLSMPAAATNGKGIFAGTAHSSTSSSPAGTLNPFAKLR